MKMLRARGLVVDGNVRDLEAMAGLGIPVWSRGTSVIGAGAQSKAWSVNVKVHVDHTVVEPVSLPPYLVWFFFFFSFFAGLA